MCSRSSPGEKLDVRQGGDMMGARSFFDNGNRGATTTLVAETDSQVLVVERTVSRRRLHLLSLCLLRARPASRTR